MTWLTYDARVANRFKVPKKQWGSWTFVAQHTFNKLYETMIDNQDLYRAPGAEPQLPELWKITAWNAAWMAASIVSRGERHLLKDLTLRFRGR